MSKKILMSLFVIQLSVVCLLICCSESTALSIAPIYGDDSSPWGTYGGDVLYGDLQWSANDGTASFSISLDPSFTIFAFSFNVNIDASDFVISIQNGVGWSYRGLNTVEGIGTDHFDFTLWRSVPGETNLLEFSVAGSNIASDNAFYRPNLNPSNPTGWDALLHQSHFGVYASNTEGTSYILSDSQYGTSTGSAAAVPEPSTLALLTTGVVAAILTKRRKSRSKRESA